jgi:NAD(P)-dependent dehydrogenase (short-subunit alcohol dehydrogenase family)
MSQALAGKVAFITGAASGIGEATARRFAREGATIVLADVEDDLGKRVCAEIEQEEGRAFYIHCDVSDAASVQPALESAASHEGRLDIVYANAGIAGVWAPLEEMLPSEWEKTLRTNLEGAFLTLHFAIPYLKSQGGSIIITSSVSGNRTFAQPGAAAYSTSKAGLVALTKMAALELARYRIRVNAVCPGGVPTRITDALERRHTEEIPLNVQMPDGNPALHQGVGQPEDIADVCLFLASDQSRHVSGVEIYVDGGASLIL